MLRVPRLFVATLTICVCSASYAAAEDAYYDIPISELKVTSGELPRQDRGSEILRSSVLRDNSRFPRIVIDRTTEAYLRGDRLEFHVDGIVARAPEGKDLRGTIVITNDDGTGMQQVEFTVPASAANPKSRETFNRTKQAHYERLRSLNLPGGAWFRHQENEARKALGNADPNAPELAPRPNRQFQNESEMQRSYALFSGGRAVSENLQLDRELLQRGTDGTPVGIDTLTGITVTEIDWKEKVKDLDPQLDPLAKLIPSDQHVLFVPSVTAATKLVEQLNGNDTVLLRLAEARIENAGTFARYERQLGLSLKDLPENLVATLALTGSDPYYRTGTDVAVLLETKQPAKLAKLLLEKIQKSANTYADAASKEDKDKASGTPFRGFATPDRRLSAYVAELPGAVVVTNSQAQLMRLFKSVQEKTPSIASLDEYKFFRNRYSLGDKEETGFVFLSDPTIRRWCSPKWRIATSRRTRNAAVLAELQAQNVVAIATGKVEPHALTTDLPLINSGELALTADGVLSTGQGSLAWMTPIVELPIQQVTKTEANAYNAWRDGYQRNWTGVFDPIGLRLIVADEKLAGDLTIMPLIAGSEYREIIAISQGAAIAPNGGDPHGALAHAIVAINLESPGMVRWSGLASMIVPTLREVGPFSWLGSSVSLYVDDDPLWKEIQAMTPEERNEFSRRSLPRLPIALHAEVSSGLKLAGFLAGLRTFIEQSGPGLTVWEPLTYRDQSYVRVRGTEEAQLGDLEEAAIYYTASAQGLTVSPNEEVIKRAIDRRLARKEGAKAEPADKSTAESKPASLPWLGTNFCLQVDRKALELAVSAQDQQMQRVMQSLAWSNLPILNEWKRMFPDQNPVEVHEQLWAARPVCPGGGEYVWNDEWQTMESTVYGHPGEPRNGPAFPEALKQFEKGNFGVTFEEEGLRARMELLREIP